MGPIEPPRTLAALWGQAAPAPTAASGPGAPAPKRKRKNEAGQAGRAGQTTLVRGELGLGVRRAEVAAAALAEAEPLEDAGADGGEGKDGKEGKEGKDGKRRGAWARRGRGRAAAKSAGSRGGSLASTPSPRRTPSPSKGRSPARRAAPLERPDIVHLLSSDHEGEDGPAGPSAARAAHPFFSAKASTSADAEAGAAPKPDRRRKIVFAADRKPTHGFFARPHDDDEQSELGVCVGKSGVDVTARGRAEEGAVGNGKAHAFFSMGTQRDAGRLRSGWGAGKEERAAPWPAGEWPSHVGSVAGSSSQRRTRLQTRARPCDIEADAAFWSGVLAPINEQPAPPRPVPAHPQASSSHPALLAPARDAGRETWCERYRPRRASHVLGNAAAAVYLRDWLRAQQVGEAGAGAGRRVVRRVSRRRAGEPSWIVDDLNDEVDEYDEIDALPPAESLAEHADALGGGPAAYPSLDAWLANTILLAGPSGSGKGAAVYAAAHELGWDVFEVYPGVGKRTGAGLAALVGDVGKNHMVGHDGVKERQAAQARAPAKVKAARAAFFGVAADDPRPSSQGSAADPIEIDAPPPPPPLPKPVQTPSQSLILIDEADILFDEEATFWPAVVALAAESHRPIVLTCNDPTRIPRAALPLQTTLHFHPPARDVAEPYLGAIAAREGIAAGGWYDAGVVVPVDLVGQPRPPNGSEPAERFDLRRAIMQMQLDRACGPARSADTDAEADGAADLKHLARSWELRSYADAWVAPRSWARMDICEVDRYAPGPDDEEGVRALVKPEVDRPTLPAYDRAGDYARALGLSCLSDTVDRLQHDRTSHIHALLPLLDPLIPLSASLLPHPALFLDVVPAVSAIVRADDVLAAAERAAVAAGERLTNRKTGRPMRITSWLGAEGYVRWLELPEPALAAARRAREVWLGAEDEGSMGGGERGAGG